MALSAHRTWPSMIVVSLAALVAAAEAVHATEPSANTESEAAATRAAPEGGRSATVRRPGPNTETATLGASRAGHACTSGGATLARPFAFTVDGQPVGSRQSRSNADSQRCTDVALAATDVQIRYDGLNSEPWLNVVATPDAALKGDSVYFKTHSNYALLTKRGEIRIFEKGLTTRQTPTAIVAVDRGIAEWRAPATIGDRVTYVLRVYDAHGRFDETTAKTLDLAAVRAGQRSAEDLMAVYNGNAIEVRNIPISGGAILVSGRNVPQGHAVKVMGMNVPVDAKGSFAVRQIVATGAHEVSVAIGDPRGQASVFTRSAIIPDHDFFYVALADLTVGQNATSGPMAGIAMGVGVLAAGGIGYVGLLALSLPM